MTTALNRPTPSAYGWEEHTSPTALNTQPLPPPVENPSDPLAALEQTGGDTKEEDLLQSPERPLQYKWEYVTSARDQVRFVEGQSGEHFWGWGPDPSAALEQTSQNSKKSFLIPSDPSPALEQTGVDTEEEEYVTSARDQVRFGAGQSGEHFWGWGPDPSPALEQTSQNSKEEDLANALRDLREVNDEAEEEGIPPPSESVMANADRLIRSIYDILPRQYLVELLPEGVIAITVSGGFRRSVMLLCESDGGALCSVNINGQHRRKRYVNADQLPDRFLREVLDELGQE